MHCWIVKGTSPFFLQWYANKMDTQLKDAIEGPPANHHYSTTPLSSCTRWCRLEWWGQWKMFPVLLQYSIILSLDRFLSTIQQIAQRFIFNYHLITMMLLKQRFMANVLRPPGYEKSSWMSIHPINGESLTIRPLCTTHHHSSLHNKLHKTRLQSSEFRIQSLESSESLES